MGIFRRNSTGSGESAVQSGPVPTGPDELLSSLKPKTDGIKSDPGLHDTYELTNADIARNNLKVGAWGVASTTALVLLSVLAFKYGLLSAPKSSNRYIGKDGLTYVDVNNDGNMDTDKNGDGKMDADSEVDKVYDGDHNPVTLAQYNDAMYGSSEAALPTQE